MAIVCEEESEEPVTYASDVLEVNDDPHFCGRFGTILWSCDPERVNDESRLCEQYERTCLNLSLEISNGLNRTANYGD